MGKASVPGVCGELLQGTLCGQDVLVTCPINRFARASVRLETAAEAEFTIRYRGRVGKKVKAALDSVLVLSGSGARSPVGKGTSQRDPAYSNVEVLLQSELPWGKGMGSSSAEMVSVMAAAYRAYGREPSPEELSRLAAAIEPTDAVMYPGIVAYDHRRGSLLETFGAPPALDLLMFDTGGTVDTEQFNRSADLAELNRRKEPLLREAWDLLRWALRRSDPEGVAHGATLSALAHQLILPKPQLDLFRSVSRETGGLGLCVAHSGTVVGLLYKAGEANDPDLVSYAERRLPAVMLGAAQLIGGGMDGSEAS